MTALPAPIPQRNTDRIEAQLRLVLGRVRRKLDDYSDDDSRPAVKLNPKATRQAFAAFSDCLADSKVIRLPRTVRLNSERVAELALADKINGAHPAPDVESESDDEPGSGSPAIPSD